MELIGPRPKCLNNTPTRNNLAIRTALEVLVSPGFLSELFNWRLLRIQIFILIFIFPPCHRLIPVLLLLLPSRQNSRSSSSSSITTMRKRKASLDINCLPDDLLIEIIARVASSSSTPVRDIISVRQSCKSLNKASKARMVGQCFSVDKEWKFHWWHKKRYFSLIRSCAKSGNVQANFILGLELIYNKRDIKAGLRYLKRAVAGGHYAAAYAIGVLYFRDHVTRHYGIELLNELSDACGGKQQIVKSRKEVVSVLRKITFERWSLEQSLPCTNPSCGRVESMGWWDEDQMDRRFCSELCRWTDEFKRFLKEM